MSVNKYDKDTDTLIQISGNATVPIDDTTSATDKVYSSKKVKELLKGITPNVHAEEINIDTVSENILGWCEKLKGTVPGNLTAGWFENEYINETTRNQKIITYSKNTYIRSMFGGTWSNWKSVGASNAGEIDLNTITINGLLWVYNNSTNKPNGFGGGALINYKFSDDWAIQHLYDQYGNNEWFRAKVSGNWSDWKKLATNEYKEFTVSLEANQYVAPFSHFAAINTGITNIKSVVVIVESTKPICWNITNESLGAISFYSTAANTIKVRVYY